MRNNRFEPDNLNIEKGSIVEWRVSISSHTVQTPQSDPEEEDGRDPSDIKHIIAFENAQLLQTESQLLRVNDTFRVRFLEVGSYQYKCQIYPRMKGLIRVFENVHQILSKNIPKSMGVIKQAVFPFVPDKPVLPAEVVAAT